MRGDPAAVDTEPYHFHRGRAPLAALQRRHLRQPDALRMKLNAFQTVVCNPSWHIACTTGTQLQSNN
jgi:hypothetical protein